MIHNQCSNESVNPMTAMIYKAVQYIVKYSNVNKYLRNIISLLFLAWSAHDGSVGGWLKDYYNVLLIDLKHNSKRFLNLSVNRMITK